MNDTETNHPADDSVRIEKLVYGGEGLARHHGRVLLIPFVLPGELAKVEIPQSDANPLRLTATEILEPSPDRTTPGCPYFYRCGGCQIQHATYEAQVATKKAVLLETMQRIGKFEIPVEVSTLTGEPWMYRNRTQFHLRNGQVGLLAAKSHDLVPITHCPISSPRINEALQGLLAMTKDRRFPKFVQSIEFFTNETDVQLNVLESPQPVARTFFEWAADHIPGLVTGSLEYPIGDRRLRVGYRSFFQVNRFLAGQLPEVALDGLSGDTALDLYSGVGLFTLPLAAAFREVTGVESSMSAIRDMEQNASAQGRRVKAIHQPVDAYLKGLEKAPDLLVADPPRAGLGKAVTAEVTRLQPPQLVLISCDPATHARDLAVLLANGYRINRMVLVDLFPQTYHLETITHLSR